MASPDKAIHRKLQRARRLLAGASTPGERRAARAAVDRLSRRLAREQASPPLDWLQTDRPTPDAPQLHRKLDAWERGEICARRLQAWARKVVDQQLMPDHPPEHPESIPVELVMVLSALEAHGLDCCHIPQLRAFLDARDPLDAWRRWFTFLASPSAEQQVLADVAEAV
ncbi:MAG: hypothetical protein VX899_25245 [Myxococcota bacterium]|nr:hypothetical protein [Myxococcota bacterium]